MKKFIIFSSIVLSLVLFSGFVCALGDSVMDLSISGTKEISPNAFQLTYSVETSNVDAQKAIKENKEISDDLYKSLNSMINKNRGDVSKHGRVDSSNRLFSQKKHRKIEQRCQNQVGQNSGK